MGSRKVFLGTISTIKAIISDAVLTADQKVLAIDAALNNPESKQTRIEQSITDFKSSVAILQQGQNYYDLLEGRSLKLQNRVADIVRQTIFDENCGKPFLLKAILHYQKKLGNIDKSAPVTFLSTEQRSLMIDQGGKFRVSLYKALLYLAIFDAIKSGVLNLIHSEKYHSLDDYQIPKSDWEANKADYLQQAQLCEYSDCKTTLKLLDQALEIRYQETNNRFIAGDNEFLTFRKNGTFHVFTPKLEEVDSLPLGGIFPEQKDDILHTSSDGQKAEVAVDSLNANYSFKYLGKEKGVSIISFIDMRQMMWHSTVISSAEREAAYVIDGLMHNDVIKSDIHSTDTHGYSEVIFAVTYFVGFYLCTTH